MTQLVVLFGFPSLFLRTCTFLSTHRGLHRGRSHFFVHNGGDESHYNQGDLVTFVACTRPTLALHCAP